MATRRTLKAAEAIREVVAMSLLTDLKDPRVQNVTVTAVEVSNDMRNARVLITVRGDAKKEDLALRGLQSAGGFLQQKCARRIDTRYTPHLRFEIDEGVKNLIAVSQILEDEKRKKEGEAADSNDADFDQDSDDIESDIDEEDGEETEEVSGLEGDSGDDFNGKESL